jgi:hypothetical protein
MDAATAVALVSAGLAAIIAVSAYWYLDEVITVLAARAPDLAEAQIGEHHPRRPRPHPLRTQLHHMKFVETTSMSRGV